MSLPRRDDAGHVADLHGRAVGDVEGAAEFGDVLFSSGTLFDAAIFNERVQFAGSQFKYYAHFKDVKFCGPVSFTDVTFKDDEALFDRADFQDVAEFIDVTFDVKTDLCRTKFGGKVLFERVTFGEHSTYGGGVSFQDAVFREAAHFVDIPIHSGAYFGGAVFDGDLSLARVTIWRLDTLSVWPAECHVVPYPDNPEEASLVKDEPA